MMAAGIGPRWIQKPVTYIRPSWNQAMCCDSVIEYTLQNLEMNGSW